MHVCMFRAYSMLPQLLGYQRRGVAWMLHQEGRPQCVDGSSAIVFPLQVPYPYLFHGRLAREPGQLQRSYSNLQAVLETPPSRGNAAVWRQAAMGRGTWGVPRITPCLPLRDSPPPCARRTAETVLRLCSSDPDMLVQYEGRDVKDGQHAHAEQAGPLSVADIEYIVGRRDTGAWDDVVLQRSTSWLAGRASRSQVDGSGRVLELRDSSEHVPAHIGAFAPPPSAHTALADHWPRGWCMYAGCEQLRRFKRQ